MAVLQAGSSRLAVGWYITENDQWISDGIVENLTIEEMIGKIDQPCILTGELSKEIREASGRT